MTREQIPPLDPRTTEVIARIITSCLHNGYDQWEELNRQGLLVTPAVRNYLASAGVDLLLRAMATWTPVEMLRRVNRTGASATPTEMYEAMRGFVTEFAHHLRENGL